MSKLKAFAKRYRLFLGLLVVNIIICFVAPEIGATSIALTKGNIVQMLSVIPPIFLLIGLLDVWVERETLMKYMGEGSGFRGGVIAFIMGSVTAGPLYGAFPVAGILLKKGAKITNVYIFIGAWSTTKIPMLLYEASALGVPYTLLRLCFSIIGLILIAVILEKTMTEEEKVELLEISSKAVE